MQKTAACRHCYAFLYNSLSPTKNINRYWNISFYFCVFAIWSAFLFFLNRKMYININVENVQHVTDSIVFIVQQKKEKLRADERTVALLYTQ